MSDQLSFFGEMPSGKSSQKSVQKPKKNPSPSKPSISLKRIPMESSLDTKISIALSAPTTSPKTISEKRETPFDKAQDRPHPAKSFHKTSHSKADLERMHHELVSGLRTFFDKTKFKRGVLGISGGVDSALTLKIAVDALGAENVVALIMPELGITSQENIDHAKLLCSYFGVQQYYSPINNSLMDFRMLPWKPNKLANMNVKARIRMCLLYSFANSENALVLGTSNKSEMLLGYGTKFGDLACDVEVIGDLFKTEVIALADAIGLPPEIVNKKPTAELAVGQTDEEELGASYQQLDQVLAKLNLGVGGCVEHGMAVNLVHHVFRIVEANRHKTVLPPVIHVQK